MAVQDSKPTLFLVVLGGRTNQSNVELHDVRWVAGYKIEDTIDQLRQQWFGAKRGLHIDSYLAVRFIDGFCIKLVKEDSESELKPAISNQPSKKKEKERLWFVNLGGYEPTQMAEIHQFGLVVANSAQAAKNSAKHRWLKHTQQQHKDDLAEVNKIDPVDDCLPIEGISGWRVELEADPHHRNQDIVPDWYGYWRIDKKLATR
ncbi:MAG: Uncharacterised protein [Prochlorococcus marinus str. MIT 9215]|nr:MAG: Uncharacterised protein [Prochlorococcus marinus str. MIT 9215]